MNRPNQRASSRAGSWLRLLTLGYASAAALIGTAQADDSEIYISTSTVPPNIMLILDTSGSMQGRVSTQLPYDPQRDYVAEATGACASIGDRVYYTTGYDQGIPPSCDSNAWISSANQRCADATRSLASSAGAFRGDRLAQWRRVNNETRWRDLLNAQNLEGGVVDAPIDCENDGQPYPNRRSTGATPGYTNNRDDSYFRNNGGSMGTLYSARYVAYFNQFSQYTYFGTRLEVMQQAATSLLNSVTDINVGLMRYSANVDGPDPDDDVENGGGMVLAPVAPISQNKDSMISLINGLIAYGSTPLSETYYEAQQYFAGRAVDFGNTSQACTQASPTADGTTTNCVGGFNALTDVRSVAGSRVGNTMSSNTYSSPATQSCQKNYVVYLTDGQPTSDNKADGKIKNLPGFRDATGSSECDGSGSGDGRCLGSLAEYMFNRDLRPNVDGEQNVTSYFIGFGDAFGGTSNSAFTYLENAAERGGGKAYKAGDLSELSRVFTDIFGSISENSSTLTAPTVAVNAFNRTQTLNDLYISLFQPSAKVHWPGNLKKYTVVDGKLKAKGNADAVGANGMFIDSTSDYWSTTSNDGGKVELGGAALQIPAPAQRNVYTYLGANPGTKNGAALAGNAQAAVVVGNALLTDALLGTDANNPTKEKLIAWARGADVDDKNGNNDREEARFEMGDPMHSQPAVVIYDGDPELQTYDAVVFTATNDGYLHAISTEDDGEELWAFIPKEMLGGLKSLYVNDSMATKNYAIDGDLRVLKYDVDGDGIVEPADNDRVLLFFSTGRNTNLSRYYALDVTDKNSPRFLWSIGPETLTGLGQAWSRPAITRVNIRNGQQNTQKLVLVFGGGYDSVEEAGAYVAQTEVGNRVFMIDALYGRVLWSAGEDDADLELERMTHSIPSDVNVVDLDGDGFADRMYVGDMAAQLWRFDIFNGRERNALVTGGVIASLGAKDAGTVTAANTRRFYNAPDTALLQAGNARPFMNIGIGSGYRGHPLSTENQDRFYSIRDLQPFAMLTQQQYDDYDILTEADLMDITENLSPTIPAGSRGWLLQLNLPSYQGEKVLASATTLDNVLMFTTYIPNSGTSDPCMPASGTNRAYFVSAFDGSPLNNRDSSTGGEGGEDGDDDPATREDRYEDGGRNGIARGITTLLDGEGNVTCVAGVKVLNSCKDFGSRIKTYWRQTNAN